ncbi:MAG: hypothetical protein HOP03_16025 [Lysobacter sp.]|nr:hypothetical protein [Lysobacter sp.]
MSASKKRTLADFLGASNTPNPVPEFNVPRITVREQAWSEISSEASASRALVTHNQYRNANTWKKGYVDLSHTHGEFKKVVSDKYKIQKHNVSTAELGSGAKSFPKIVDRLSDAHGAKDALRVLKGTHLEHGLLSTTKDQRRAAVELGTEIGVSEYLRGGTVALTDASINLYRVKHGNLAKSDFSDHTKGYSGAGEGGAERLRTIKTIVDVFKPYDGPLKSIYDTHASLKPDRPWETGLSGTPTTQEKYDAWRGYKFQRWTRRE